ncbi:MAG: hypothetical protein KDD22_01920 [Bdellovibrionales bacterium]|nr:hypothetical protein [Bdellovibrionales bacterium]
MKKNVFVISIGLLALVSGFQACTPGGSIGNSIEALQKGSTPESLLTREGVGVPFDGKTTEVFRTRDTASCSTPESSQNLKNEIIKDDKGYWLTVDDCKAVSARRVEGEIEESTAKDSVRFNNQVILREEVEEAPKYERIKCVVAQTDHLALIVYESENGLSLHNPREWEMPGFIPVTATRETGLDIKKKRFDWSFTVSYSSSFWNEKYKGLATLILRSDEPGQFYGLWRIYSEDGTELVKKEGPCTVNPHRYSW